LWASYNDKKYCAVMSEEGWSVIWKSAPLHDLGKVAIPDELLLKPGKLTEIEFNLMKRHSEIGSDALLQAERRMGYQGSYLDVGKETQLHITSAGTVLDIHVDWRGKKFLYRHD
jgi:putative two-component system response regulator